MKTWFWLGLNILISTDCFVLNLNISQVCGKFTNFASHVQDTSCFIYDQLKFATWDQAAGICKNLKTNLPYGYSSRLAWFPSMASYVDTMNSFTAQAMFDSPWIGVRKRSDSYTRYDMYWSSDAVTPVKPFNWPEANSEVAFSLDTDHCFMATALLNVDTLPRLEDLPCDGYRPYVCEITSDPTPIKVYNPQSCIDHCKAIGGLQYGKSCFLVSKRGDLPYLAYYDSAAQQCQGLGSGVVYGSVSRLAHFDESSWNFVKAHLQGNPWAPDMMWIGMRIQASSNKPMWVHADGSERSADWTPLTNIIPESHDSYGAVRKSDGQWQTWLNTYLYRSICEIDCRTYKIGSNNVCPSLPPPVNSENIEFRTASRLKNTTVATTCKADHHKSHYNEPKCVSDFGQLFWDDILPKCQRFTCNFDEEFEHNDMVVTYKGVYPFPLGTVVSYRCDNNLQPPAGQLQIMERKCQLIPGWNFTVWVGPQLMCSKPCPVLQIEHGSVSYSDDQRRHGSLVVNVECEPGHVPFQQDSVCTDGRWLLEPVCKGIQNWLCPPGKSLDGVFYTSSSCYWITDTKVNWYDSHDLCASEEGRLAAMPASDLWNYYANTFMLINEQCFDAVSTQTTTESSDRACGMRCRTVDYCQSFTYHLSTKDCQLHQEKPFDFLDKMTNSSDCMTGYMIG